MTITATPSEISYAGDGVTVAFAVPFPFDTSADLKVTSTDSDGNVSVLSSGFSVSGGGGSTGAVTFGTAPASGVDIGIYDNLAQTQPTLYTSNDAFPAASHMAALDRVTRLVKRLQQQANRCFRTPDGDPAGSTQMLLPSPSARASRYLAFDADGIPEMVATVTDIGAISQSIIGALLYPQTAAESAAVVTPTNYARPPGCVNRYGTNTTPGTTDMTAAIQAAFDQRAAGGANPYGLNEVYRTTAPIVIDENLKDSRFYCERGAVMQCDHNGNGIDWIVQNENYPGNVIEDWIINGPNTFLPAGGYVPPSTGVGINMNRNATTNIVTAYSNVIRNVTIQGFLYGLDMQAVIGLNCENAFIQFNQYGVRMGGGQTNANHFTGCHIRYNRKQGIASDGTTGGSLSNATANVFQNCLIESNTPYESGFPPGGTPPGDSVGIALNNSYNFIFDNCYIENHAASIYLSGGSKNNRFIRCLLPPGGAGTRLSQIYLAGAGIDHNEFDVMFNPSSTTEVHIISDSAAQLYNKFSGDGINFISGSIAATLDYDRVLPSQNYAPSFGVGVVRRPSWGYKENVAEGTNPGEIDGIGTASATLNCAGYGEIRLATGITGNTTIDTFDGLLPGQFFTLVNLQSSFSVVIDSTALSGNLVCEGGVNVVLNQAGQSITFFVTGAGLCHEVGRNFYTPAQTYTRSATVVESRTLAANASATAANNNAVLAALIADLQSKGVIG